MNYPEKITDLALSAVNSEPRQPDAAALLIDAAAMLAVESGMDIADLADRLQSSFTMLAAARAAVAQSGASAGRAQ